MFMSFQKITQALGRVGAVKDAFFNYVSLLINTTGTNGAQNNTFLDSSSNNYTITRNGTPTQGTFTPFSQTGWSTFVNGQNNYFETTTNFSLATNTTTFTIETWLYMSAVPTATGYMGMMSASQAAGASGAWFFGPNSTRYLKWDWYDGTNIRSATSTTTLMELGTWYHVAISVNANAITMYVNGVPQSLTGTTTLSNRSGNYPLVFGQWDTNASYFYGYVSNTRIISGQSLFSGAFTPATTPLTLNTVGATGAGAAASITGTVLFLGNQNNRYLDNSASAFNFNRYGTAAIQNFSAFAPTAAYSTSNIGGSGYFNGAGDYLTVGATAPTLNFGTGDFTVECWIYPTADASIQKIYDFRSTVGAVGFNLQRQSGSVIAFQNSVNVVTTGSNAAPLNAWTYIVASRVSGNSRLFINGVLQGTAVSDTATYVNGTNRPVIGVRGTNTTLDDFTGYITTAKVVIGSGVTSVTLPTEPSTSNSSNVYLGFTNAGIYDASTKNTLLTVGNASVSTAQAKFSPTSIAFDGTGDYVSTTPVTVVNAINNSNCTLEMWVYSSNSSASLKCLIDTRTALGASTGYGVYQTGNNVVVYGGPLRGNAVASLNGNTWTHLAVTRAGATNYVFLNGTLFNTFSYGNTLTSGNVTIGVDAAASNAFTGFIEEVRITNGVARYTTNFSVPTTTFPVQ